MDNKAYIGHGTKHNEWNLIDVVLDMEKIDQHIFEYEGKRYLKFAVAERKQKSQYGATHAVYVRVKQDAAPAQVAEPEQKSRRKKKARA